jgi:hypothetical protein
MSKALLRSLLLCAALAACGQPAFEDGFNKEFAKSAQASCLKSAGAAGVTGPTAETYCTCFVREVSAWPMEEKLNPNPNSEKFRQAVAACRPK